MRRCLMGRWTLVMKIRSGGLNCPRRIIKRIRVSVITFTFPLALISTLELLKSQLAGSVDRSTTIFIVMSVTSWVPELKLPPLPEVTRAIQRDKEETEAAA